jgi:hypothetical protein
MARHPLVVKVQIKEAFPNRKDGDGFVRLGVCQYGRG